MGYNLGTIRVLPIESLRELYNDSQIGDIYLQVLQKPVPLSKSGSDLLCEIQDAIKRQSACCMGGN